MRKRNEEMYNILSKEIRRTCINNKYKYYNEIFNNIESLDKPQDRKMHQKLLAPGTKGAVLRARCKK